MPDNTPPDNNEEQPAWMTPEGRLREIPIKDLSAGEQYTEDELKKLREYWTEERTQSVIDWMELGTSASIDNMLACIPLRNVVKGAPVCDLRAIDLERMLVTERTESSPLVELALAHLEHADFTEAHLEHAYLVGAHLERARVWGGHLEHANLWGAHLQYAHLWYAHLDEADLRYSHMQHAELFEAWLEGARFEGASLEHAELRGAKLKCACLNRSHLEHADLTDAQMWITDFRNVYLDRTVFRPRNWRDEKRRDPEATMLTGFDVRGIRYSDPLFDRWVRQSNFVRSCRDTWWNPWRTISEIAGRTKQAVQHMLRWALAFLGATAGAVDRAEKMTAEVARRVRRVFDARRALGPVREWPPPLWLLWNVTCDCGRSFLRWAAWCLVIALVFGFIFWLGGVVEVPGPSESGRQPNALTYFYFSIVTFTTLGFGDVTPTGNAGEVWVMLEVILGYIGLGGLISIFTTKLIPPR